MAWSDFFGNYPGLMRLWDAALAKFVPPQGTNGAAHITVASMSMQPYYDATYNYYCEAPALSSLSDPVWKVLRETIATGALIYAGTGAYDQPATSLAVVGALTYTLGV